MFFAAFVVGVVSATERFDHSLFGDCSDAVCVRARLIRLRRPGGERDACVAVGGVRHSFKQLVGDRRVETCETALVVCECVLENRFDFVFGELVEHQHASSAKAVRR